ncbi:MAG: P1 family peptidase [Janthinobacterium lividum]
MPTAPSSGLPAARAPRAGRLQAGALDAISDVAGVTVGHATLTAGAVQTGVTVIRPHAGDVFRNKVPAAAVVFNGFGKSIGLMQLEELGLLETPIALTNTLSVGAVATGQIQAAIEANPGIGRTLPTVNPLVFECNDGYLNDIQAMIVEPRHYHAAAAACAPQFGQGAIGAGRGMSCFDLKGGIGSSSRVVSIAAGDGAAGMTNAHYCVGALVLANFGKLEQLTISGLPIGERLLRQRLAAAAGSEEGTAAGAKSGTTADPASPEMGSIIMIIATDAPLDARQLRRLAMRCGIGLGRTGSIYGHGSGDLALAFSTAATLPHQASGISHISASLHDHLLDPLFQAVTESIEQSILNALYAAESVTGFAGHQRQALCELLNQA